MLGICIAFRVTGPATTRLCDHSVARIRALTQGPYRLFGTIARGSLPDTAERLRAAGVELPDIPPFESGGTREHGYFLNAMVDHAVTEGCTHVATFDMDAWPVEDGWDVRSAEEVSEEVPIVAALRAEVHTNFPFPGFTFMRSDFWKVGVSSFMVESRTAFPEDVVRRVQRPIEPGAGILCQLLMEGKAWIPLARSNGWNAHKVMAGLYGDRVFHLAGGSREPTFGSDGPEFSLNGSELRSRYRQVVNVVRQDFLLDAAVDREEELLTELRGESLVEEAVPAALMAELNLARSRIRRTEKRIARLQARIRDYDASLSWRLTAPLRWLARRLPLGR